MISVLTSISTSAQLFPKLQTYSSISPWPENGYDLRQLAIEYNASIQKFSDNDTLYYIKMANVYRNKDAFYYLFINEQAADSILRYALTKEYFEKSRLRSKWFIYFMRDMGASNPEDKTEWTLFDPNKQKQPFTTKLALEVYKNRRKPAKTKEQKELEDAAWMEIFKGMQTVINIMGGNGGDNRTLYDKVMQEGGY